MKGNVKQFVLYYGQISHFSDSDFSKFSDFPDFLKYLTSEKFCVVTTNIFSI